MGVGASLYMYDVVVKKFMFAVSSPAEFLFRCLYECVFVLRSRSVSCVVPFPYQGFFHRCLLCSLTSALNTFELKQK